MRIFVTGATGFVGRNFLQWLVRNQPDAAITCLVRDPAKAAAQWPITPAHVRWLPGDLLDPKSYAEVLRTADYVFHTAALVSLRDGPEFYAQNAEATRRMVQALEDSSRLSRLVFTGSISAVDRSPDKPAVGPLTEESIPHPNTDYGKSKLQAEEIIRAAGVPFCILRPSYIYGPFPRVNSSMDRLVYDVARRRHYTQFPFPGRTTEVYAEDLAEMIWLAAHHQNTANRTFFVGNPQPVTIGEVYPALARVLGVPYTRMQVDPADITRFQRMLYRMHPGNLMLRILFEDYFWCDTAPWYAATGYRPRCGYEEGMAKTVRWYRENGLL